MDTLMTLIIIVGAILLGFIGYLIFLAKIDSRRTNYVLFIPFNTLTGLMYLKGQYKHPLYTVDLSTVNNIARHDTNGMILLVEPVSVSSAAWTITKSVGYCPSSYLETARIEYVGGDKKDLGL